MTRGELFDRTVASIRSPDETASADALRLLDAKTKPPGSLGRLEELACRVAGIRSEVPPRPLVPAIVVAAADHGVAARNVSAYPQEVTAQMLANFASGGAAVCVLAREARARLVVVDVASTDTSVAIGEVRQAATWRVPDDAGRRYAKVSGDVNPIHLSGLSAKAFGFKRAIAHGMWVKARALAALSGRLPDALSVDVGFQKPLFLPSTVALSTAEAGGGWDFAVRNAINGSPHLVGTVRPV